MMRILVATDFSEPSLVALEYAMALIYTMNGGGFLLHVIEEEPVRRYAVGREPEAPAYWVDLMANALRPQRPSQVIYHDLCEEAQWKLSALLPPAWHDRFRTLVVVGKPAEEIVGVARDRRVDLIMMGGRRRRGVSGLFRRSLAAQVGRRAAIPVITVSNSGHAISDQLRVREGIPWGWPDGHRTGKWLDGRKSKATSGYLVPMSFFLMEMGIEPKEHFSKLTFSGSHEASILAVANKKVDVASTNLPDVQQMVREGKVPRGAVRVIWVSKLIPNDPIVVRKDLPEGLKQAIQQALMTMHTRHPEAFAEGGAWIGGFVQVDDAKYQIIRDLNETAKRLAALK